jgi:hypothetical protein
MPNMRWSPEHSEHRDGSSQNQATPELRPLWPLVATPAAADYSRGRKETQPLYRLVGVKRSTVGEVK